MKLIHLITFAAALLTACATISKKEDAPPRKKDDRTSIDAPIPDRAMAQRHNSTWNELGLGHAIYMRKCGECHLHLLPDEIKSDNWHVIVPGMAWNAGIEPHEQKALLSYLKAAAKDAENKQ